MVVDLSTSPLDNASTGVLVVEFDPECFIPLNPANSAPYWTYDPSTSTDTRPRDSNQNLVRWDPANAPNND